MSDLKYKDITEKIIGAAMKVHATLGNGFQEVIYQRALAIEMRYSDLSFEREYNMKIFYRDKEIGERRVDFFVKRKIIVELKAIIQIEDVHLAQAKNYLEAYNMKIGFQKTYQSKISFQLSCKSTNRINPGSDNE